jgi:hypothetical protein
VGGLHQADEIHGEGSIENWHAFQRMLTEKGRREGSKGAQEGSGSLAPCSAPVTWLRDE